MKLTNEGIIKIRKYFMERGFFCNQFDGIVYTYQTGSDTEVKKSFSILVDISKMFVNISFDDIEYRKLNPYQPRQVIMKYNWKISDLENIDLLIHNIDKFISISLGRIGVEW